MSDPRTSLQRENFNVSLHSNTDDRAVQSSVSIDTF
jgi:hypothetical protein